MKLKSLLLTAFIVLTPAGVLASSEAHGPQGIPVKAVIFATINLVILLAILVFFLRKPAKEFFASRSELIRKGIEDSQALKQAAEAKYAEYESRLQGIEAEMQKMIQELKEDGDLERARIIATAQEQVVSLQNTSERIMTQELRRAKEELKREAVTLAAELAEELVKKNMTPEDQKRIVQQYLTKMEGLQ